MEILSKGTVANGTADFVAYMTDFELGLSFLLRQSLYRPSATLQFTAARKALRRYMASRAFCTHGFGSHAGVLQVCFYINENHSCLQRL